MLNKEDLNERSKFGKDEFYEKLRREIPVASSESSIYDELYLVIKNDEKPYILTQTDLIGDVEDILHDIYLSVFIGLPEFLDNPDYRTMSEEEWVEYYNELIYSGELRPTDKDPRLSPPEMRRQSWLATITKRRIFDFRKHKKKEQGINPKEKKTENESVEQLRELEESQRDVNPMRDLDEDYNGVVDSGEEGIDGMIGKDPKLLQEAMDRSADREYEKKIPSALLVKRLQNACSLNLDPDRLMAFIYSSIIIPLELGKMNVDTRTGKPTAASRKLKGKKLGEVFDGMKTDLDTSLEKDLPDSIYSKLEKRLDKVVEGAKERDKIFNMTAAKISDASHRANDRIDEMMAALREKDDNTDEIPIDDQEPNDTDEKDNNKKRR